MSANSNKRITHRERLRKKHAKSNKQKNIKRGILYIILLTIIFISTYSFITAPKPNAVTTERLNENPFKGNQNAVVTLTEYGDFGCEACQSWHESGIIQEILNTFEGQIKFVWKDFPVITSYSPKAAEAGQCAFDQGKFWEFHDVTYERESYSALSESDLLIYAEEANLDLDIFSQCLDSNQHKDTVNFDLLAARELGLRGTPSFLVNDIPLIGANPNAIVTAIRSELKKIEN